MSVPVLVIAALAFAVAAVLVLGLLRLVKRSSRRRAVRIPERGAPPRWSTLHLEEVARLRARPKRLPRRSQGIRLWEGTKTPGKRTDASEN
jgi:hypothetical protein